MDSEKGMDNLELFYDVFDASCNYLYEITKANYFDLILMTGKNILAGEVVNDVDADEITKLTEIYKPLENIDFDVEDVRKALQSIILRGFKESKLTNGGTTPDTLGIFTTYLISKLEHNQKRQLRILDPLVGSGNFLFTIANHLSSDCLLFGSDHNEVMTKICQMQADLMNQPIEIFLADTLNISANNMDYIVFDLPVDNEGNDMDYFPYKAILHYEALLNNNGYIIAIIPNDFFDHDLQKIFNKQINLNSTIVGLIELPKEMFVSNQKSILIISKKKSENRKCLMAELPSFSKVNEFNKALNIIEEWFSNNLK